jgi:haloalkane dehalogenase
MKVLRTPDERFHNLPGWDFKPRYVEINGARVHYVDEGAGETILCLHGEPSWSYLYRKIIPLLSERYRVIAMDLIGFGRSDKFAEREAYSFDMHRGTVSAFITQLDLTNITMFVIPRHPPPLSPPTPSGPYNLLRSLPRHARQDASGPG